MQRAFFESRGFSQSLPGYLSDDGYLALQLALSATPDLGAVMPGCGGLRKLRWGDPRRQKGKRGGVRVIYIDVPEAKSILFVDVYGKDEQSDLSPAQKRFLRTLAHEFRVSRVRRNAEAGETQ